MPSRLWGSHPFSLLSCNLLLVLASTKTLQAPERSSYLSLSSEGKPTNKEPSPAISHSWILFLTRSTTTQEPRVSADLSRSKFHSADTTITDLVSIVVWG